MSKSPAFQFYPADYLSDANTVVFTAEQDGHYLRLLCFCWLEGSIPSDPEEIQKLLKGSSRVVEQTLNPVLNCFQLDKKSGRLVHLRLLKEKKKQSDWRKKCAKGGKASGESRRGPSEVPGYLKGSSRVVEQPLNTMFSSSSSSSSSISNKKHISENFEKEWKEYPRKAGNKKKAEGCYFKSVGLDKEKRKQFLAKMKAYVESVDDPNFLMYGGTFFRNWEDIEIPEKFNKPENKTVIRQNLDLIKNIDLGGDGNDNGGIQAGDSNNVRLRAIGEPRTRNREDLERIAN